MTMKNSSDTIGNQTREFPAYSAVPQTTAPPRAPNYEVIHVEYYDSVSVVLTQLSGMQNIFSAPFYIIICCLSVSIIFFDIIS
jgi:hypothetical protein